MLIYDLLDLENIKNGKEDINETLAVEITEVDGWESRGKDQDS